MHIFHTILKAHVEGHKGRQNTLSLITQGPKSTSVIVNLAPSPLSFLNK